MSYSYGTKSLERLNSCHPNLMAIFNEAIKQYDISIIEGSRSNERQNLLFDQGLSKLRGGESKHNETPSLAIDAAPYPINWEDTKRFFYMAGIIKSIAFNKGISIIWGGDWDNDNNFNDQSFNDLVHFELEKPNVGLEDRFKKNL